MKNANKSIEKKERVAVLSASKSVKFKKDKTPISQKKKFAKTPHSSKSPKGSDTVNQAKKISPLKNKRKLSFSSADETPVKSPKNVKNPKTSSVSKSSKALANDDNDSDSNDEDINNSNEVEEEQAIKTTVKNKKKKFKVSTLSPEAKKADKETNTVFVGNLPNSVTKAGVLKEFSKFGTVMNARLRCIPLSKEAKNRKAGAILQQFAGTSLSAYVKFSTAEGAKKALSNNGKLIGGHHLRVDLADPALREETDKKKAIFLRHLPIDLTEDELWSAFEKCGKVHSVRLIKDTRNYINRGLGYVNFTSTSSVELALKLDGTELKGKSIVVQRCETVAPKPKKERNKVKANRSPKINKSPKKDLKAKERKNKKTTAPKSPIIKKSASDFSGNKSRIDKKKKTKKLGATGLKKKQLAEILSK